MNDTIRILVVDDHALVRGALCEHLRREPGFSVVGTAATADEAVTLVIESTPDIVLMDIDMPGMNCFNAARTIQSLRAETRIVFLSAFAHDRYIEQALAVRARGYLTKREPPEAVVAAIPDYSLLVADVEAAAGREWIAQEKGQDGWV